MALPTLRRSLQVQTLCFTLKAASMQATYLFRVTLTVSWTLKATIGSRTVQGLCTGRSSHCRHTPVTPIATLSPTQWCSTPSAPGTLVPSPTSLSSQRLMAIWSLASFGTICTGVRGIRPQIHGPPARTRQWLLAPQAQVTTAQCLLTVSLLMAALSTIQAPPSISLRTLDGTLRMRRDDVL